MRIIKGPLPPSVLVKSSRKSDDVNGQVKVKRKCGRPRNPIPRHKRESHINAEHRRRGKIQDGFRTLKGLVPKYEQTSGRDSKAEILFKAVDYCKVVQKQLTDTQSDLESLKAEKEALTADIKNYKTLVPEGLVEEMSTTLEDRYSEYVQGHGKESSRAFWAFSFIMRPLFESYAVTVDGHSPSAFMRSVTSWAQTQLSQDNLSTLCTVALGNLSLKESKTSPISGTTRSCADAATNHVTTRPAQRAQRQQQKPPQLSSSPLTPSQSDGRRSSVGTDDPTLTSRQRVMSGPDSPLIEHRSGQQPNTHQLSLLASSPHLGSSVTNGHGLFTSGHHQSAFHRPSDVANADGFSSNPPSSSTMSESSRHIASYLGGAGLEPRHDGAHEAASYFSSSTSFPAAYHSEFRQPAVPTMQEVESWHPHSQLVQPQHPHHPFQTHDQFYTPPGTSFVYPPYTPLNDTANNKHSFHASDFHFNTDISKDAYTHTHEGSKHEKGIVKQEHPHHHTSEQLNSFPITTQTAKSRFSDFDFTPPPRQRHLSRSSNESEGSGFNMASLAQQATDSLADGGGKYSQLSPSTDGGLSPSSGSYIGSPGAQASSPNALDRNGFYRNAHGPHVPQSFGLSVHSNQAMVSLPSYATTFGKPELLTKGSGSKCVPNLDHHGRPLDFVDFKAPRPVNAKDHSLTTTSIGVKAPYSLLAELLNPVSKNSSTLINSHYTHQDSSHLPLSIPPSLPGFTSHLSDTGLSGMIRAPSHFEMGSIDSHHRPHQDFKPNLNGLGKPDHAMSGLSAAESSSPVDPPINQNSYFELAHQQLLKSHAHSPMAQSQTSTGATSPGGGNGVPSLPIFPACGLSRTLVPAFPSPHSQNGLSTSVGQQLGSPSPLRLSSTTSSTIPSPGSDDSRQPSRKCSFEDSFPDYRGEGDTSSSSKRLCTAGGGQGEGCPFSLVNDGSSPVLDSFRAINNMAALPVTSDMTSLLQA